MGLIVPLSIISTERMEQLQSLLINSPRLAWLGSFDVYPSKLFEGAKQRLTIVLISSECGKNMLFTTHYNRWKPEERTCLFPNLSYWQSLYHDRLRVIPKVGSCIEQAILRKIHQFEPAIFDRNAGKPSFYVHRIPYNYVKAVDFVPYFWNEVDGEKKSEDYKPYSLLSSNDDQIVLAILNSSLFFWWWYTLFEGYHCGRHEIEAFPIGLSAMHQEIKDKLRILAKDLMEDLRAHSIRKECHYKTTGRVIYEELSPRWSKVIIDQIDYLLAQHYGFTDDEVDFIVNYDLKYRTDLEGDREEEAVHVRS